MKIRPTIVVLVIGAVAAILGAVFALDDVKRSGFPDLSKFEFKTTCIDQWPKVKLQGVVVELYALHFDERASYNEIITVITMLNSGKKFAARNVIEGVYGGDPKQIKGWRKIYEHRMFLGIKNFKYWREIGDNQRFISEVVKSVPKEYLLDYQVVTGDPPREPQSEERAYRNLLYNSGCSLHGPVG